MVPAADPEASAPAEGVSLLGAFDGLGPLPFACPGVGVYVSETCGVVDEDSVSVAFECAGFCVTALADLELVEPDDGVGGDILIVKDERV